MDIATHLLLPYAAALIAFGFWRRSAAEDRARGAVAAVFGIAGMAPDIDGLFSWMKRVDDSLFWLQHRGISHSLVGAPLFALAAVGLLAAAARAWPSRFGLFAWRQAFLPAAILGSWTHLILDGITYGGVPLLFPFAYGRWGVPLFHWLVEWMFPIGALALAFHAFGKLSHRGVIVAGALLVVILLVLGGVRLATRPSGEWVYPRTSETDWVVIERAANGSWSAHSTRLPDAIDWFPDDAPPDAAVAIARAKETNSYHGFLMGEFGPMTTQAERSPGGGWSVTFTSVAQRYEAMHDPRWTPTTPRADWGLERLLVENDRVSVLVAGW